MRRKCMQSPSTTRFSQRKTENDFLYLSVCFTLIVSVVKGHWSGTVIQVTVYTENRQVKKIKTFCCFLMHFPFCLWIILCFVNRMCVWIFNKKRQYASPQHTICCIQKNGVQFLRVFFLVGWLIHGLSFAQCDFDNIIGYFSGFERLEYQCDISGVCLVIFSFRRIFFFLFFFVKKKLWWW